MTNGEKSTYRYPYKDIVDGIEYYKIYTPITLIKTIGRDRKSFGKDFFYPKKGFVACRDWDPHSGCGNGIHACLTTHNMRSLVKGRVGHPARVYVLLEAEAKTIVHIGSDKVKVPYANVMGIFSNVEKLIQEVELLEAKKFEQFKTNIRQFAKRRRTFY